MLGGGPAEAREVPMSRFVENIQRARRQGRLPYRFRAEDLKAACPGWADRTYKVFLSKHRVGNPGGYTPYFKRRSRGLYSLIDDLGLR